MTNKQWKYREGSAIVAFLLILGEVLQLTIGSIKWELMACPVNIIVLVVLTGIILIGHFLRKHSRFIRFISTRYTAVPLLLATAVATAIYGVTNIQATLSFWPFVLLYLCMDIIVGLVTLKHLKPNLNDICMTASHAGIFIAITAATLGNADMQRLRMMIDHDHTEYRAVNDEGKVSVLPFGIELHTFTIDEYPPKLVVIDNETGDALPHGKPQDMIMEDSLCYGDIHGYHIETIHLHRSAVATENSDSIDYKPSAAEGSTAAALVKVSAGGKSIIPAGWVSCGSYLYPDKSLRLNDKHSLVMLNGDAKRYASEITVHSDGKHEQAVVEVNKPYAVGGWKIYQLSYDQTMGRWSKTSVLELVHDPWLPFVYLGIALLVIGAIVMFLTAGRKEDIV